MKHRFFVLVVSLATLSTLSAPPGDSSPIKAETRKLKALIMDGQNNHDIWPKTTSMMRSYLEQTKLFSVDIARMAYTWQGDPYDGDGGITRSRRLKLLKDFAVPGGPESRPTDKPTPDPNYKPEVSKYNLVLFNFGWHTTSLLPETQRAIEDFVKNGGGLVVVHAANNAFGEWIEFNKMIGVGGWGGRDEKSGPYLYYDDHGVLVRDPSPGPCGSHGHEQNFLITIRNPNHPITRGMPKEWLHFKDELYDRLRGPAEDVTVLGTAYSDHEKNASFFTPLKGTNRHEPMVLCRNYGKGRVFHLVLGHFDYSMECVGFIVLLQRGAEWAATGNVTQSIPKDFPTADHVSIRQWLPQP